MLLSGEMWEKKNKDYKNNEQKKEETVTASAHVLYVIVGFCEFAIDSGKMKRT